MEVNNQIKNNYIDFLKGFLIFLVVLGHEIQSSSVNFDSIYLFKFIYSFHMPFFILISGYLASMSVKRSQCSFEKCIKKKFYYLIVPFLSWFIIGIIIQEDLSFTGIVSSFESLINHVDNGLWYLYVLFVLYIFLYVSYKIKYKYIVLLSLFLLLPMTNILGMNLIKWYLIYFILGMALFDYQLLLKNIFIKYIMRIKYLTVVLFILSLVYWEREFGIHSIFLNAYYLYAYKFFTSLLGIISVYIITKKLFSYLYLSDIFNLFGKNSMKIYILNVLIINYISNFIIITNQILVIILALFICYFIVVVANVLSKFEVFAILFGVKYKNVSV